MRHYIGSFAWILLLAASTACQRVIESDVPESVERPQMTISATLEGGDGTRTVLGNPGNSLYRSYWKDSDEIAIYADGAEHVERFVLQSGAGTSEATFSGPQSSGALVGLYPYSSIVDETLSEDYVLTLELPEIQHYAKDSFGDGAYPMLAVSYSSQLVFKNLCALLQLSITGSYPIEAITFRAHDSAMSVSGKATVRTVYDYVPDMVMREGGSPEVTLQCDGVELDASTPTLFFLVIPPGTYKDGFEIEIISKAGKMVRSTRDDISFSRSQYRTIPSFAFVPEVEPVAVPEPIDLGLPSGLKWASFNLGASKPEEYGDYYAWGETEPYYSSLNPLIWKPNKESGYIFDSYTWSMGDYKTMTKYCTDGEYSYNGFTDGKTVLDLEDDAAHISLGGNWRMPTKEEFDELLENCSWTWTTLNGVYGLQITSAVPGYANQSIFLPAAGSMNGLDLSHVNSDGSYWLSSLTEDHQYQAYQMGFYSSSVSCFANPRCLGFSIRPVYDDGTVTKIVTIPPTNIGPCSAEIPFTISTQDTVYEYGVIYSTNRSEPMIGNLGDGNYIAVITSEVGSSRIINELKPNTTYYARAFVILGEEHGTTVYGNTIQFTTKEISYSSDYVDIGLSVAWATCNLGSSTPSNVGGYYRWGETDLSCSSTGYIWSGPDGFTKYNANDGKVTLEASDDAASVNLGGKWRMPTNDELTELRNNCTWTPTTQNGVKGSTVTGPNGKSIFIPISEGYSGAFSAELLSSSLSTYSNDAYRYVHALSYRYDENSVYFSRTFRNWGVPIRPVYDDSGTIPEISVPEPIDLGLSVKWSSFNLGATKPEGSGALFAWGETQPKGQYTLDNYLWYSTSDWKYTKYNWRSDYGVVDNKIFLDVEDDAANFNLGGDWRMPTDEEMMELMYFCDWTFFENYQDSGISGCVVRGKKEGYTDNYIFIPSGVYQNSSLQFSEWIIQGPYAQQGMHVGSDIYESYHKYVVSSTLYRADGWMIRPVSGPRFSYSILPINVEFGEVPVGTTAQKSVLITNTGELPFEMKLSINAPFSADVSSISLDKGESMTIKVSFTPSEAVEYHGNSYVSYMGMPRNSWINIYGTGK